MAPDFAVLIPAITGSTRRNSSSAPTTAESVPARAPGRVDSPPTSTISAPSSSRRSPCAIAASGEKCCPPSENESGVTFTIPTTAVRLPNSSERRPRFHVKTGRMLLILMHLSASEAREQNGTISCVDVEAPTSPYPRPVLRPADFAGASGLAPKRRHSQETHRRNPSPAGSFAWLLGH